MNADEGQGGFTYVGTELDLFAAATVWKGYVRDQIRPFLGRNVLEVGAGLGGSTRVFCRGDERRWLCLEPDASLASRLDGEIRSGALPACCESRVGTLADLGPSEAFDTILYMDVLEHIEDDRGEVARASALLAPGGHVVALSPAHQRLYSPFDRAIGHFRRYDRVGFGALCPEGLETARLVYLDSVGLLASLANALILRSPTPTAAQIAFWDRVLVRLSKVVDPLVGRSMGKSVLAAWRKPSNPPPIDPPAVPHPSVGPLP